MCLPVPCLCLQDKQAAKHRLSLMGGTGSEASLMFAESKARTSFRSRSVGATVDMRLARCDLR